MVDYKLQNCFVVKSCSYGCLGSLVSPLFHQHACTVNRWVWKSSPVELLKVWVAKYAALTKNNEMK